jgi:hypothetical protein
LGLVKAIGRTFGGNALKAERIQEEILKVQSFTLEALEVFNKKKSFKEWKISGQSQLSKNRRNGVVSHFATIYATSIYAIKILKSDNLYKGLSAEIELNNKTILSETRKLIRKIDASISDFEIIVKKLEMKFGFEGVPKRNMLNGDWYEITMNSVGRIHTVAGHLYSTNFSTKEILKYWPNFFVNLLTKENPVEMFNPKFKRTYWLDGSAVEPSLKTKKIEKVAKKTTKAKTKNLK